MLDPENNRLVRLVAGALAAAVEGVLLQQGVPGLARLIKPGQAEPQPARDAAAGLAGSVIGGVDANLLGTGGIF